MRKTIASFKSLQKRLSVPVFALALSAPLALTAATMLPDPAAAQSPQCAARTTLLENLSKNYDEAPVSMGVTNSGSLIEILTSPAGSWTILVTVPGGPTCLVSSGDGWRDSPVQVARDPAV